MLQNQSIKKNVQVYNASQTHPETPPPTHIFTMAGISSEYE